MKISIHKKDIVTSYYESAFIDEGFIITDDNPDIFFTDTSSYTREKPQIPKEAFKIILIADAPKSIPDFINDFDLGVGVLKPEDIYEYNPKINIKLKQLPWAFSPKYFYYRNDIKDIDVSFIGGQHHQLNYLTKERYSNLHPEEVGKILNKTKITWRDDSMQDLPNKKNGLSLMPFEASACGCMCLQKNKTYFREYFTNKEMIGFETEKELKELVGYYLNNEIERSLIVSKALKRVIREHSFNHRVRELLKWSS